MENQSYGAMHSAPSDHNINSLSIVNTYIVIVNTSFTHSKTNNILFYFSLLFRPVVIGLLVFAGIVIVIALGVCTYVGFYKAKQAVNKMKKKDEQGIEMQTIEE